MPQEAIRLLALLESLRSTLLIGVMLTPAAVAQTQDYGGNLNVRITRSATSVTGRPYRGLSVALSPQHVTTTSINEVRYQVEVRNSSDKTAILGIPDTVCAYQFTIVAKQTGRAVKTTNPGCDVSGAPEVPLYIGKPRIRKKYLCGNIESIYRWDRIQYTCRACCGTKQHQLRPRYRRSNRTWSH